MEIGLLSWFESLRIKTKDKFGETIESRETIV